MTTMCKLLWGVLIVVIVVITSRQCQAVVVLEHKEVTLTCDISPTAPRTSPVFWLRVRSISEYEYLTSGDELTPEIRDSAPLLSQRLSVVGSSRRGKYNLRITDVRADDAGEYGCGYYQNDNEWVRVKTVTVEVLTPPGREFPACSVESPGDTLLLPGMLANLSCISYGGSPPADLAWYRAGVPLDSVVAHDGLWVYHQRLILEDDSGVEFTCEATSSALLEPKRCTIVPYRRAPLLYVKHVHDGLVGLGDSATFTCAGQDAEEVPVPASVDEARYQWYFNGYPAEDSRSGIVTGDGGRSLTLLDITSGDNKAVVSCEKVDEFTARSSATMAIQVVSPLYPMPIDSDKDPTPSWRPDSSISTPEPLNNVSHVVFITGIVGAFCCGMFFMFFLILVIRLVCHYVRKRGRLDFSTEHEIAVGWRKTIQNSPYGEKHNHVTIDVGKPVKISPVRTFKKPNGVISNGNVPMKECVECLQRSNTDEKVTGGRDAVPMVSSPQRSTPRPSQPCRQAKSYDLLPSGTPTRKKPPPLSLFNDTRRPLLSSPSPTAKSGRRLPSEDGDCTASMPDLATRYFGGPMPIPDHDYVNFPALPSSKEGSESSTPSSYVNCEFVSPVASTSPVRKQSLKPLKSDEKSLSYAELDLPRIRDRASTTSSPQSLGASKLRAGSVSAERTKYAQITYVFKDRRQQSLPSVKLVGLTEGFGDKV